MSSSARLVLDPYAIEKMLKSPAGLVGRDLLRKAIRMQSGAKRRCPVDTGRLRQSIRYRMGQDSHGIYAEVGSDVEYASAVENGHGEITPVNGRFLHFFAKDGTEVFTLHVRATQGVHFLKNSLQDIR